VDVNDANSSEDPLATLTRALAHLDTRVTQLERTQPTASAPARLARQLDESAAQLETKLGTYWLIRIGIVSLITGTALLILTYFGQLGPVLRVALGYLIAAALLWTGRWIGRRHALFGNVIFGGGLAGATVQLVSALAFFVAERLQPPSDRAPAPRTLFIAGSAVGLLRFTFAVVPAGFATLGWVAVAFALFATGFALHSSRYRWAGFAVLALAALHVAVVDLAHLSANQRILTFVGAGILLLVVSFIYTRLRARAAPDLDGATEADHRDELGDRAR